MIVLFKPSSRTSGDHPAFEYPGTMKANEAGALGEAVCYDAGNGTLTKCAATGTPDFILLAAVAASATPTVKPPCIRVDELQEYETKMGAVNGTPAPVVMGSKLTLHTDGLTASYVTTSGVFQVSGLANTGNAVVGDAVTGYFRR